MQETQIRSLGQEDLLEKGMANHSSIFLCKIPWTEEPGGLQSMGRNELDMTERLTLSLSNKFAVMVCAVGTEKEGRGKGPWWADLPPWIILECWGCFQSIRLALKS